MLKQAVWSAACGALGLLWFMIESLTGRLYDGTSNELHVLWLIVCPICVVGSMVHMRRELLNATYSTLLVSGLKVAALSAIALLIVWVAFTQFLMPDYTAVVLQATAYHSQKSGMSEFATQAMIASKAIILKPPMVFVLGSGIPFVAGALTAAIAAIGLKSKKDNAERLHR